jgi:hypothetical protein
MLQWIMSRFRGTNTHETIPLLNGEAVEEKIISDCGKRYTIHTHRCCDCGVEHTVRVDVGKKSLTFAYWRE